MPFTGNSRVFGFTTRMRTSMRCEKMSALCTFIEITDRCGASSLSAEAQPESASSAAVATSHLGMVQHVRRDEHDAFFRDEETLRVLEPVMSNAGVGGQLAVLVDDRVPDLAVRPDPDVRQHHRTLHV